MDVLIVETDERAAADKLAGLDSDLKRRLAEHHAVLMKIRQAGGG